MFLRLILVGSRSLPTNSKASPPCTGFTFPSSTSFRKLHGHVLCTTCDIDVNNQQK